MSIQFVTTKPRPLENVQGEREKSSKTDLTSLPHLARHLSSWLPSHAPPRAELYPTSPQCGVTTSLLHNARCGLGYLGLTLQVWHCLGRAHFLRSPAKRLSVLPSQPLCDNIACLKLSECRSSLTADLSQVISVSHLSKGEVCTTGKWWPKHFI